MSAPSYKGAFLLTLALLLGACAAPQSGARSSSLAEVLRSARAHPELRTANVADCEAAIARKPGDFPYKAFFAGLLGVAEKSGGQAFCAALIEAVIAGDLSQEEQDAFKKPKAIRGRGPAGVLLRELMIAHERLAGRQARSITAAHTPSVPAR